jgi:hypothetical protein
MGSRILDQLERGEWFANAGQPPQRPAVAVASWAKAADSGSSYAWTDTLIAATNALSASTLTTPALRARWNALATEWKPRCAALATRRLAASPLARWVGDATLPAPPTNDAELQAIIARAIASPSAPSPGRLLLGNVEWIVLHAALEAELGGDQVSGFFRRATDWFVDGHFMCGWRGDLATGLPIVF